jgi:NitT/TauT family transport system substrate-binding protein
MKFGMTTPAAGATPVWLTKEDGLFLKYGIDAEFATLTADLLAPAQIAGEVQLATMAATALVNADLGGADLAFYGSQNNQPRHWFYVRPEIQTIQDLRGKQVGISGRGGMVRRVTEIVLERNGLDADRDVQLFITGSQANSATSLLSGAVAGSLLSAPGSFQAEDEGMRLLVDTMDYRYLAIQSGFSASRAWVARNEDLTRRTLMALAEGMAVTLQHKERAKQVMAKYLQTGDTVLLDRTYDAVAATWTRRLAAPPDALLNELEIIALENPLARDVRPEQFIDNRFADELERSGFLTSLYP